MFITQCRIKTLQAIQLILTLYYLTNNIYLTNIQITLNKITIKSNYNKQNTNKDSNLATLSLIYLQHDSS